jgi:branched-subunit amino acid ABC-type transport system permease component
MGDIGFAQLVNLVVGGLAIGCVYSLIALGFAMIMRATSIIHFAQGEVMMLGCMCGLTSLWLLPALPLPLVLAVGMVCSGIVAVVMEIAVYRTLRHRRVPLMNVITATVGMSILCINAARIVWGSEPLRQPNWEIG